MIPHIAKPSSDSLQTTFYIAALSLSRKGRKNMGRIRQPRKQQSSEKQRKGSHKYKVILLLRKQFKEDMKVL